MTSQPRTKSGAFATSASPVRQKARSLEASIQREFFTMVRLHGGPAIIAFAIPNERSSKSETIRLIRQGLTPGAADVVILWPGGGLLAEFKSPAGKQSPEQKAFQAASERAGWPYRVFRSWDAAWATMVAMGAPVTRVVASTSPLRLVINPALTG